MPLSNNLGYHGVTNDRSPFARINSVSELMSGHRPMQPVTDMINSGGAVFKWGNNSGIHGQQQQTQDAGQPPISPFAPMPPMAPRPQKAFNWSQSPFGF